MEHLAQLETAKEVYDGLNNLTWVKSLGVEVSTFVEDLCGPSARGAVFRCLKGIEDVNVVRELV